MKFSKKYIVDILSQALRQGTTPEKLALTCALGVVIGIFPIIGTTTLICLGVAILFKLNLALLQLVNYLVTALQVILILPFIQTGIFLFGLKSFDYTSEQLVDSFQNNFWSLLKDSGLSIAAGITVWFLIAVPLFVAIYFVSLFFFKKGSGTNREEVGLQ